MSLKHFYKTKNLADYGLFLLVSLVGLLVLGMFIPKFQSNTSGAQIYTVNGFSSKHDDHSEISDFFQSITKNKGYLILGTSESVELKNGNYPLFLNNDADLNGVKFSVLAGAGRTCGNHIPLFVKHKEELDSLKIIYLINPVYWREDLSRVNTHYWERYVSVPLIYAAQQDDEIKSAHLYPTNRYLEKVIWLEEKRIALEHYIRFFRRNYFHHLRYLIDESSYESTVEYVSHSMTAFSKVKHYGEFDANECDTTYNIAKSFRYKEWFKPINTKEDFRYKELQSFIHLCKDLGIQATFIVTPINERFIEAYQPKSLKDYHATVDNIKQMLIENDSKYIDATDINRVVGAFDDHQHHSSYGAYLLYSKIKQSLNEK